MEVIYMDKIKLIQLKEDILSLLTDKNAGLLVKDGQLDSEEESFGALVMIGKSFKEVSKVFNSYGI